MSGYGDEEMDLFGETSVMPVPESDFVAEVPVEREAVDYPVVTLGRFPYLSAESRLIKLPKSALSVNFSESVGEQKKAANAIQCRTTPDGATESNARLVEWEDGSWTLAVGSEHFRIIERPEDVLLFDKQDPLYVSIGAVMKQFNVIPGSLDSRTHRHVVEQTAVSRKLTESRKVALAHTHSSSVNTIAVKLPQEQEVPKRGQPLTADFLEAGLAGSRRAAKPTGNSVRAIKAAYRDNSSSKRRRGEEKSIDSQDSYEDEDVEFEDPSGSVSESELSEDGSGSSSSGSASSSTSSSGSESSSD